MEAVGFVRMCPEHLEDDLNWCIFVPTGGESLDFEVRVHRHADNHPEH